MRENAELQAAARTLHQKLGEAEDEVKTGEERIEEVLQCVESLGRCVQGQALAKRIGQVGGAIRLQVKKEKEMQGLAVKLAKLEEKVQKWATDD